MKRHSRSLMTIGLLFSWLTSAISLSFLGCADPPEEFTFVQMCDPQIRVGPDDSFFQVEETVERFETAIQQINALDLDFVVICGDFVQRSSETSFAAYRDILTQFKIPCHAVPGNHDYNPSRGDERATVDRLELYRKFFGDDYFHFAHEGHAFICINTPLYLAKGGGDHWRVEPFEGDIRIEYEKQDAWLRKTLKDYKETKTPVFIVAHHPLHPDMPGLAPGVLPVHLRQDLFSLFRESGVIAVLGGHGHKVFIQKYDKIAVVHAHTTSFILEQDPEKRDDFGFRLWRVHNDGTFTHEYVPLDDSWREHTE